MSGFSLYIHIPYCFHKCPYCDFNTYAVATIPEKEYVEALLAELDFRASEANWRGKEVQTIFFGGGTPSLFSPSSIRKILAAVLRTFPGRDDLEISLEANPGTVTSDSFQGYREAGVNRISIGAQSLNVTTLKRLGRMHSPEQVGMSVEHARSAGFHNINLDLIYGIEGQTVSDIRSDLQAILNLSPEHVSAYGLTIEKGTPFYVQFKKGLMKLPTEECLIEMMHTIKDFLSKENFTHYEISNFAKAGREAKHNLAYWNGHDYLGLGAGAHSFVVTNTEPFSRSALRWSNFALPAKYIKECSAHGKADSWQDKLDREKLMFEYFFLGLRKIAGVTLTDFEKIFSQRIKELYPLSLDMLIEDELIVVEGDNIRLTERGILLSDSVVEQFIEPQVNDLPAAANG